MIGILEKLLTKRYGDPRVIAGAPYAEYRWRDDVARSSSILYKSFEWNNDLERRLGVLRDVYGDVVGGFVLGDSLKISTLRRPKVYGLYPIEELQQQPEVVLALRTDPAICFFMDSANVWFYGLKNGELLVYDSETEELDRLGPIEIELERLISEWEQAKA